MEQSTHKIPHRHLTMNDIVKLKSFYEKHGVRWRSKRDPLIVGGHRGRLDKTGYKRYCRLLRRIHYEINCVSRNQPIRCENNMWVIDMPYNRKFKEVS